MILMKMWLGFDLFANTKNAKKDERPKTEMRQNQLLGYSMGLWSG